MKPVPLIIMSVGTAIALGVAGFDHRPVYVFPVDWGRR